MLKNYMFIIARKLTLYILYTYIYMVKNTPMLVKVLLEIHSIKTTISTVLTQTAVGLAFQRDRTCYREQHYS